MKHYAFLSAFIALQIGGGGFKNLNATELRTLCPNGNCNIISNQTNITNTSPFSTNNSNKIELKNAHITNFTNTSTIKTYEVSINGSSDDKSYIEHFYNYGSIETSNTASLNTTTTGENGGYRNIHNVGYISGYIYLAQSETGTTNITNYGTMGGVVQYQSSNKKEIIINNFGTINLLQENGNGKKIHFKGLKSLTLKNYTMKITSNASAFNSFDGNATDNSHLVLDSVNSVTFADSAKIFLEFGGDFSINSPYSLDKLIVDTNGDKKLAVEFDRLVSTDDFYKLIQQGNYFSAQVFPKHSAISNISKANIRTMNNFWTLSNSMIYPRKLYHSQNLGKKNLSFIDSAIPLKSYESFSYRNESINRRIQRQNKRNYNRKSQNLKENQRFSQNLNADSTNKTNQNNLRDSANYSNSMRQTQNLKESQRDSQTQRFSQNLSQTPHNYYFILTPFINYNSFAQSGNYNLRGFDYGFLTAFSAQVAESNYLGAHFIFSYGSLGDSKDKDLSIKSLNLNVGLNYKLDLIYDMYLKARGDFYYFSNTLDSLTIKNIKPNNLGFGVSVAYGKDFNFGKGGVLGIEAGLDYKALKINEVSLNSQTYKQSLYNLIYADVGVNYNKYFGGFGINLGTGFKANLAPKLAESTLLVNTQTLKFTIDNDKYLGYANAGISYVLNTKNFDMEFSLAYYGNFGDRVISNGGGVEWRVGF